MTSSQESTMSRRCLLVAVAVLLSTDSLAFAQDPPAAKRRNVAIVIHDGVELLNFAGPGEVFQAAGRNFHVYTVSEKVEPITSQGFLKVTANHSVKDCPKPDIIVIPGGNTGVLLRSKPIMDWLKASAPETEVMFSVCTGAFALGELGLLDGQDATTHHGSIDRLKKKYPKARIHADRRVVDNGKVVTAAGVSAGIDGALHVVARLCGMERAKGTARYMEYRWEPETIPTTSGAK
jgi:transcriptional regulator GlxA family with amidase domain